MSNISCILYPPTLDYHYLVQRPQQLMKNFSELNIPTYYLNNPSPHNNKHGVEKLNEYFYLFNQVDPEPYLSGMNPVVYYTSAAQAESIGRYNPALVVFDSVDEPSDEFEAWRPYYDNAVRSADIVLTTSDKLYNLAAAINPNVHLIPNGCDYDHFSNFIHARPAEIANLPGPIIGYIGVVATWVDVELIARVADSYPDYSVVVVGPLYNVSEVPERPNIHWLGFKSYEQLPAFAQSFDVGLIPFKSSSMTEAVNPIKMWEYMATGMPVVTTNLPEARKYGDLVFVSETIDEFIFNVGEAILEKSAEKRNQRMELALENSWRVRASQIVALIEEKLALKGISGLAPISQIPDISAPQMTDTSAPQITNIPTPQLPPGSTSLSISPPQITNIPTPPFQGLDVIVPAASGTYSYSQGTQSEAVVKIFTANRVLKIRRKKSFKIVTRSKGQKLTRSTTSKETKRKISTHPQIKVRGGAAFKFDTGRNIKRCVC